jgi:hypothetical protein
MLNEACASRRPKIGQETEHAIVILLGYRLIGIQALGPHINSGSGTLRNRVERALHLGLTAFVSTLLVNLDRRVTENSLLAEAVRTMAQEDFSDTDGHSGSVVLLWLLFLGSMSVLKPENDDSWLLPRVKGIVQDLGLEKWQDVERVVGNLPWLGALYNKRAEALWIRAVSRFRVLPEAFSYGVLL